MGVAQLVPDRLKCLKFFTCVAVINLTNYHMVLVIRADEALIFVSDFFSVKTYDKDTIGKGLKRWVLMVPNSSFISNYNKQDKNLLVSRCINAGYSTSKCQDAK